MALLAGVAGAVVVGCPATRLARSAARQTLLCRRLVGLQTARRLLLLGARVPAAEAVRPGMVAEVTTDEALVERASEIAAALAAKSPEAVAIIRDLVDRNTANDLPTALAAEADAVAVTLGGAGCREALAAFAESRTEPRRD